MGLEEYGYETESKNFRLNRMDICYEGSQESNLYGTVRTEVLVFFSI